MGRVVNRPDPLRPRLATRITARDDATRLLTEANCKVLRDGNGDPQVWPRADAILWLDVGGNPRTTFVTLLESGQTLLSDPMPGFRAFPFDD